MTMNQQKLPHIFTAKELICMNSILGGGKIPEVNLIAPIQARTEAYKIETIQQMQKHGLAEADMRLTERGKFYVRMLKEYKTSKTFLVIENACIAYEQDEMAVYIRKEKTHYVMFYTKRELLLCHMLERYDFLRQAQETVYVRRNEKEFESRKDIRREIESKYPNISDCFQIKKRKGDAIQYHKWICRGEDGLVIYDFVNLYSYHAGARDARMELWKLLELREK